MFFTFNIPRQKVFYAKKFEESPSVFMMRCEIYDFRFFQFLYLTPENSGKTSPGTKQSGRKILYFFFDTSIRLMAGIKRVIVYFGISMFILEYRCDIYFDFDTFRLKITFL